MLASVVGAPFPTTFDVNENLQHMLALLADCQAHELVVFPEGALTGYSSDIAFVQEIDLQQVDEALVHLHQVACQRDLHVFVGAIRRDDHGWRNQAHYLSPTGPSKVYDKVNLASHERGHLVPGNRLLVAAVDLPQGILRVGVQLCRELRFPETWRMLADAGAELFVYLTHATEDAVHQPVWRSHAVSRAAENQRWLVGVNAAHPAQLCPSLIVRPDGMVLEEIVSEKAGLIRAEIDTALVSNWYLNQRPTDLAGLDLPNG